jgi:hypothetical protein
MYSGCFPIPGGVNHGRSGAQHSKAGGGLQVSLQWSTGNTTTRALWAVYIEIGLGPFGTFFSLVFSLSFSYLENKSLQIFSAKITEIQLPKDFNKPMIGASFTMKSLVPPRPGLVFTLYSNGQCVSNMKSDRRRL